MVVPPAGRGVKAWVVGMIGRKSFTAKTLRHEEKKKKTIRKSAEWRAAGEGGGKDVHAADDVRPVCAGARAGDGRPGALRPLGHAGGGVGGALPAAGCAAAVEDA